MPGGCCILPDAYSTLSSCAAVVSTRHAQPTLSCTTVSEQRLGRRSGGQSVRGSGRGAAQLTCHQPRVTRGKRVGVENAVPRGRLAAVRGTDGRVGRHHNCQDFYACRQTTDHDVEWPCPNRSIRKTRLFFKRCLSPHIMVFEPRVCTSLELAQATGACSAERSCERWLGGWPSPASSIELELHSTKSICAPVCELEPATAADGRQARHRLGPTATRSRRRIAAWRSPRRGTT